MCGVASYSILLPTAHAPERLQSWSRLPCRARLQSARQARRAALSHIKPLNIVRTRTLSRTRDYLRRLKALIALETNSVLARIFASVSRVAADKYAAA